MAKILRFNFTNGVFGTAEPRIAGDGYAAVIHNADMRSGILKPAKAPVKDSAIASGTKWLFEFLGTWYPTPEIRDWAAEKYGNMVRLYYTIPGQSTIPPQKIIDGTQAKLGIKAPATAPTVKTYQATDTSVINLSGTYAQQGGGIDYRPLKKAGTYRYRAVAKATDGTVVANSSIVEVQVPGPDTYVVQLSYKVPTGIDTLEIYRNDPTSKSEQMYKLGTGGWSNGAGTFQDDDTKTLDFAKAFPSEVADQTQFKYFYTLERDVNGHVDESGPSPLSESVEGPSGRVITFPSDLDTSFSGDAGKTFAGPVATPIAGTTTITVQAWANSGSMTVFATTADHNLTDGTMIRMTSNESTDPVGVYQVDVPTAIGKPRGFTVKAIDGAPSVWSLGAGTYQFKLVAVRGWGGVLQSYDYGAGAMSLPTDFTSQSVTVTALDKKALFLSVDPCDCDGYYLFYNKDGAGYLFGGYYTPEQMSSGQAQWLGAVHTWGATAKPTLPTVDQTASRCFKINASIKPLVDRPSNKPSFDLGGGVQIQTGAHGFTNGTSRSIQLSGFSTNSHLNKVWPCTVTGANTVKISAYMSGASETGGSAVFGKSNSAGQDETAFIKYRNLYRIGDVTEFLLVSKVPVEQASFTDQVKSTELGISCPSYYTQNGLEVIFAPPPSDLQGEILVNGMLVGISGRTVRWTPVNKPDAWPEVFMVPLPTKPVRLVPIGGSVIIFCADSIWRLELGSPTQVYLQKTLSETGCVAPYTVAATPIGIVFLADNGLNVFDVGRNNSYPMFPNRLTRRFFLSPSACTTAFAHWWRPGNRTHAYTFLTRDMAGSKRAGMVSQLDNNPVFPDSWTTPRGFYFAGKYFLFYAGDAAYAHHGMLEVDLEHQPPRATFNGLKPMAAWVTEQQNAYLLMPGAGGGDGSSNLSTAQGLEGTKPDEDTGLTGSVDEANPGLWRFMDDLGTPGKVHLRTGPITQASLSDRVQWNWLEFHGTGTGRVKIWIDGWEVTKGSPGYASFKASETPSMARRVQIPRGAWGYTIDFEVTGSYELLAVEVAFSPKGEA